MVSFSVGPEGDLLPQVHPHLLPGGCLSLTDLYHRSRTTGSQRGPLQVLLRLLVPITASLYDDGQPSCDVASHGYAEAGPLLGRFSAC